MKDESKSGRSLCSSIFTRLIANDAIISCVQHCQRSAAALDRQANSLPVSNPLTPSCRPPYFEILKACAPSLVANCAIVPDSTDRLLVLPTASTPDVIRRQMAPYLSAAAVQASSPSHWLSDDNWRPKRRYTDMTDVCTMFHCSGKEPGTFEHIECATRNHCITLRRRWEKWHSTWRQFTR